MRVIGRNSLGTGIGGAGNVSGTQKLSRSGSTFSTALDSTEAGTGLRATLGAISRALLSFYAQHASRVQVLTAQYQSGQYQSDARATSAAMWEQAFGG
jgi:hypothetical protein